MSPMSRSATRSEKTIENKVLAKTAQSRFSTALSLSWFRLLLDTLSPTIDQVEVFKQKYSEVPIADEMTSAWSWSVKK